MSAITASEYPRHPVLASLSSPCLRQANIRLRFEHMETPPSMETPKRVPQETTIGNAFASPSRSERPAPQEADKAGDEKLGQIRNTLDEGEAKQATKIKNTNVQMNLRAVTDEQLAAMKRRKEMEEANQAAAAGAAQTPEKKPGAFGRWLKKIFG